MSDQTITRDPRTRKIERATSAFARAIAEFADASRTAAPLSRWMRAGDSPLGLRRVKQLVKASVIAGARPSKHLLIDREQHDAFIARHPITPSQAAPADDDDMAAAFGVARSST